MRLLCGLASLALFCIPILSPAAAPPRPTSPTLDKRKLEAFIRYTEGFTAAVKIAIDDPAESEFPGFRRVVAHLTLGPQLMDKIYFLSVDGQIVNGTVWDFSKSPFIDTLVHLPSNGPSFGPADARVSIVIFSDFQCPYCREFAKTIRENIPAKYPKDVRVSFEDFPIPSLHPWATAAAEAGRCIAASHAAAFWPFHDWIFEHQGEITSQNLADKVLAYASGQKLDATAIGTCLNSHAMASAVDRSVQAGRMLGVQQTPTFFINGRMIGGALPWQSPTGSLNEVIRLELARPAEVPGPVAPKS